jgi:tRNA pseudouridine38-40 synthase
VRNIKLTIAYDGTEFFGWQLQPNLPTVQGWVVDVAQKITDEKVMVWGAGRTDTGAHALGQVAHFRTRSMIPLENLQRAMNSLLPDTIRIVRVEEVPMEFHARWHTLAKTYHYRIFRGRVCLPFTYRYVYSYPFPLDEEAMIQAAKLFEGEHDFASFSSSSEEEDEETRNKVRLVYRSELVRDEAHEELVYITRGKGYLRHMVRKIVGTLIEVGKGKLAVGDIPGIFEARDRTKAGPTVPAKGLILVSVEYSEL